MTRLETIYEKDITNDEIIYYTREQSAKLYKVLYCVISFIIIFITIIILILFNK